MSYNYGKLNGVDLAANTSTNVYQAPTATRAVGELIIVNRNITSIYISVGVGTVSSTIGNTDYVEYTVQIPGYSTYRASYVVGPNQYLIVNSNTANVTATYNGMEGVAS